MYCMCYKSNNVKADLMTFYIVVVYVLTVITSKDLQKHGNIWVCPIPDHVCTRFLFVWVYEEAESFVPPSILRHFQTMFHIAVMLCFPLSQIWERPGGRHAHQHSGTEDTERNCASNRFKAWLKCWSKIKKKDSEWVWPSLLLN